MRLPPLSPLWHNPPQQAKPTITHNTPHSHCGQTERLKYECMQNCSCIQKGTPTHDGGQHVVSSLMHILSNPRAASCRRRPCSASACSHTGACTLAMSAVVRSLSQGAAHAGGRVDGVACTKQSWDLLRCPDYSSYLRPTLTAGRRPSTGRMSLANESGCCNSAVGWNVWRLRPISSIRWNPRRGWRGDAAKASAPSIPCEGQSRRPPPLAAPYPPLACMLGPMHPSIASMRICGGGFAHSGASNEDAAGTLREVADAVWLELSGAASGGR